MDEQRAERLGRNEALARQVNEAIERGLWPGEPATRFRCECAQLECNESIEMLVSDYEHVRDDPRCFVVRPGHEAPAVEEVTETHPRYLVVRKHGPAGAVAEQTDPRG